MKYVGSSRPMVFASILNCLSGDMGILLPHGLDFLQQRRQIHGECTFEERRIHAHVFWAVSILAATARKPPFHRTGRGMKYIRQRERKIGLAHAMHGSEIEDTSLPSRSNHGY